MPNLTKEIEDQMKVVIDQEYFTCLLEVPEAYGVFPE